MSYFRELFDDFTAEARLYVERLDVTEYVFMRYFTRGMQIFQRRTSYMETSARLERVDPSEVVDPHPIGVEGMFRVPQDMLYPQAVYWVDGSGAMIRCVSQEHAQFASNLERAVGGYMETPLDYSAYSPASRVGWASGRNLAPVYTVYGRLLYIHPPPPGGVIMDYVPDIHAISASSPQWAAWYPLETNFLPMFNQARVHPSLAPYERAFVAYALATFVRSNGSANYIVFEKEFEREVVDAIQNKPVYFREGIRDYGFAPWV